MDANQYYQNLLQQGHSPDDAAHFTSQYYPGFQPPMQGAGMMAPPPGGMEFGGMASPGMGAPAGFGTGAMGAGGMAAAGAAGALAVRLRGLAVEGRGAIGLPGVVLGGS